MPSQVADLEFLCKNHEGNNDQDEVVRESSMQSDDGLTDSKRRAPGGVDFRHLPHALLRQHIRDPACQQANTKRRAGKDHQVGIQRLEQAGHSSANQ